MTLAGRLWRTDKVSSLSSISKVLRSLLKFTQCNNTRQIRSGPYWPSRKISLELTELSSINIVSSV